MTTGAKDNSIFQYKWMLLGLLWFAYFLNQGDRQIFNTVIPLIKEDLGLTDYDIGDIVMVFTAVYGVLVPVSGFLGDLVSRKWIVVWSLLIFSAGTLCTGLAGGMALLILFRSVATGGGEAFYFPAATSLLSQLHSHTRATALSIHQTSLYVGIIASGFISGYIGEHYGWRAAFYVFGSIGVLWAALCIFAMRNTPMPVPACGEPEKSEKVKFAKMFSAILKKQTFYCLALAFACQCFVNVGYNTWMPSYLHEKYEMSLSMAGLNSMLWHFAFAFFGVMIGGKLSDAFSEKFRQSRMWAEFLGLFLAVPFIFLCGYTDSFWVCCAAMAGFGFFRGVYDSNLFAALFDVVEPRYRATASGLYLSFAFVMGSIAPKLMAYIKEIAGFSAGIMSLSAAFLLGSAFVAAAMLFFFNKNYCGENG